MLNSSHQLEHKRRRVCVTSHTHVVRHLHACTVDLGDACTPVRTRDSDFDRSYPRISDGFVFMDTDIRRVPMDCQACDKCRIILVMAGGRLQRMNMREFARSCKLSKTTWVTRGAHHEDILDFNAHVGSFKTGFFPVDSFSRPYQFIQQFILYGSFIQHMLSHCYWASYPNPNRSLT